MVHVEQRKGGRMSTPQKLRNIKNCKLVMLLPTIYIPLDCELHPEQWGRASISCASTKASFEQ